MSRLRIVAGATILVIFVVGACGGGQVETADAAADVEELLLGENWIGPGTYETVAAAKASTVEGDTVYAARIRTGDREVVLFWRQDASGLLIGDAVTRQYSVWGQAAVAGSPADQLVEEAKQSAAGRAVLDAVSEER